jgi:hypothetical protein
MPGGDTSTPPGPGGIMSPSQALAIACLVLEFEAETTAHRVWQKEVTEAAQVLTALKAATSARELTPISQVFVKQGRRG